jgi:hypothetical protein
MCGLFTPGGEKKGQAWANRAEDSGVGEIPVVCMRILPQHQRLFSFGPDCRSRRLQHLCE